MAAADGLARAATSAFEAAAELAAGGGGGGGAMAQALRTSLPAAAEALAAGASWRAGSTGVPAQTWAGVTAGHRGILRSSQQAVKVPA